MAIRLRQYFDSRGLKVDDTQTAAVTQTQNNLLFTVVVAFLILMALLLAAVGGLALTTTMSINIMERVREVGVLRAIGASNGSVRQIVLAEGVAMAIISWLIGALDFAGSRAPVQRPIRVGPDQDPSPVSLLVPGRDPSGSSFCWPLRRSRALRPLATRAFTVREVLAYE